MFTERSRAPRTRLATIIAIALSSTAPISAADDAPQHAPGKQFTFSWPFADGDEMRPRGGTSRGPTVELAEGPSEAWLALQQPGLNDYERDRRAILAMAGPYRTSFDFLETVHFTPDAEPDRPYQSWGTEHVYVAEDHGNVISLQHVLVMFFENDDGSVAGPVVMKHWRQDWTYEDRDLLAYVGDNTFEHRRLDEEEAEDTWSQAVFQVDDAPRYEASGRWIHDGNYSAWTGTDTWRPLPRREHSVRDDYDVLLATNRHTIVPNGWVHEENNLKMVLDEDGNPAADARFLARELGVNRYDVIEGFDFSAGDRYWARTSAFWASVRSAWADVLGEHERLKLATVVGDEALYERLFAYAERVAASEEAYDRESAETFIQRTLQEYVSPAPAR